jgi:hypothetical protein
MENDRDFLNGIDEEFERRMRLYDNGSGNGRNGRQRSRRRDSLSMRILELVDHLSPEKKEEAILFLQALKEGAEKKTSAPPEMP